MCGSDPTWGLLPVVTRAQGATALEMETPAGLVFDRPLHAR